MRPPEKRKGQWIYPDFEWMHRQYVILEKSPGQITREVGSAHSKVLDWLDAVGILRRVHSGSTGHCRKSLQRKARRVVAKAHIPNFCETCGRGGLPLVVHHKDGNSENNKLENLQRLCHSCHYHAHAVMDTSD